MARRYIITVDQEAIRKARPPIHVHDTESGTRRNYVAVSMPGPSAVVYDRSGLADGARVWIETDRIVAHGS